MLYVNIWLALVMGQSGLWTFFLMNLWKLGATLTGRRKEVIGVSQPLCSPLVLCPFFGWKNSKCRADMKRHWRPHSGLKGGLYHQGQIVGLCPCLSIRCRYRKSNIFQGWKLNQLQHNADKQGIFTEWPNGRFLLLTNDLYLHQVMWLSLNPDKGVCWGLSEIWT